MSEAKLLEGKILAAKIQEEIRNIVEDAKSKSKRLPCLVSIQTDNNSSSEWYINQQEKLAAKLGIKFIKEVILNEDQLLLKLQDLGGKVITEVDGVFLSQPFPKNYNVNTILANLSPMQDVEGISPATLGAIVLRQSVLIPPTAYAALQLIEYAVNESGRKLKGMKVAIVGQSAIVGRPLQMLLGERRATTIVCNTGTSETDLQKFISESDIVVGCAGQPGLIKGKWIKEGAIVIDVGTTEIAGKLVGDIEFDEAKKRASYITPVPGGVGPLTVTMLMKNLIQSYKQLQ